MPSAGSLMEIIRAGGARGCGGTAQMDTGEEEAEEEAMWGATVSLE